MRHRRDLIMYLSQRNIFSPLSKMCWNRLNLSIPDTCFMYMFSDSWTELWCQQLTCVRIIALFIWRGIYQAFFFFFFQAFYSLCTINVHQCLLLDPSITISKRNIFSLTLLKAVLWMTCKCFLFFFPLEWSLENEGVNESHHHSLI